MQSLLSWKEIVRKKIAFFKKLPLFIEWPSYKHFVWKKKKKSHLIGTTKI